MNRRVPWFVLLALLPIVLTGTLRASEPPTAPPLPAEEAGPIWDFTALSKSPASFSAEPFRAEGLRAIFFEGVPYQGRPTRVFAWLGLPKLPPGQTAPGIVLVHGGGGTAFETWVRLWTERGYAAIAIDTNGSLPVHSLGPKKWQRSDAGGPSGWGGFDQLDRPRGDQWTYHAVADAILAHSFLRTQPGVDPNRIGLTGISWGGYLTCIIAAIDPRFRFAIPVYGCGFTNEHGFASSVETLTPERAARWMKWWDPSAHLAQSKMPMLWVSGTNDFAYTLNALQKSYRLPTGPRALTIRPRMAHGHEAGWAPTEIVTFAESIIGKEPPLPQITAQGRDGSSVWATTQSVVPLLKAELLSTPDLGRWQDRKWAAIPAELHPDGKVSAVLPPGSAVFFFNLTDARGSLVSSEHVELPPAAAANR